MARRRSLNRRWSRRSSNNPGILNEDSNVFDEDDGPYWRHLREDSGFDRLSAAFSEASTVLDPDSRGHISNVSGNYWENLQKTSQDLFPRNSLKANTSKNSNTEPLVDDVSASDSDHQTLLIKKKKIQLRKNRKSQGVDVFSQALESDEQAIQSEPVASTSLKRSRAILSKSFESPRREKTRKTTNSSRPSNPESNTSTESEILKARPVLRRKTGKRVTSDFLSVTEENISIVGPSQEPTRKAFTKPRSTFLNRQSEAPSSSRGSQPPEIKNMPCHGEKDFDNTISQPRAHLMNRRESSKNPFDEILGESEEEVDETSKNISKKNDKASVTGEVSGRHSNPSLILQVTSDEEAKSRRISRKESSPTANESKSVSEASTMSISEELNLDDRTYRSSQNSSQRTSYGRDPGSFENSREKRATGTSNKSQEHTKSFANKSTDHKNSQSPSETVDGIRKKSSRQTQFSEFTDQQIEESLSEHSRYSPQPLEDVPNYTNKSLNTSIRSMKSVTQSNTAKRTTEVDERVGNHNTRFFNESIEETAPVDRVIVGRSNRTRTATHLRSFEKTFSPRRSLNDSKAKETESEFESCVSGSGLLSEEIEGDRRRDPSAYELPDMNRSTSIDSPQSGTEEDDEQEKEKSSTVETNNQTRSNKPSLSPDNRSMKKSEASSSDGRRIKSIDTEPSSVIPAHARKKVRQISDDSESEENISLVRRITDNKVSGSILTENDELQENDKESDESNSEFFLKTKRTGKVDGTDEQNHEITGNDAGNRSSSQTNRKQRSSGRINEKVKPSNNKNDLRKGKNIPVVPESEDEEDLQVTQDGDEEELDKRITRSARKTPVIQEKIGASTRNSSKPGPLSSKPGPLSSKSISLSSAVAETTPPKTYNSKSKVPVDSVASDPEESSDEKSETSSNEVIKQKGNDNRSILSEPADEGNSENTENGNEGEIPESPSKINLQSPKTPHRPRKKSQLSNFSPEVSTNIEITPRRSERISPRLSKSFSPQKSSSPSSAANKQNSQDETPVTTRKKITSAKEKKSSSLEKSELNNQLDPVSDLQKSRKVLESPTVRSPRNKKKSNDGRNHLNDEINREDEESLQITKDGHENDGIRENPSKGVDKSAKSPPRKKTRFAEEFSEILEETESDKRMSTKSGPLSSKSFSSRKINLSSTEVILPRPEDETPVTPKQKNQSTKEKRKTILDKSVLRTPTAVVSNHRTSRALPKTPAAIESSSISTTQTKIFDFFKPTREVKNRTHSSSTELDKKLMDTKKKLEIEMSKKREKLESTETQSRKASRDISSRSRSLVKRNLSNNKKKKVVNEAFIVSGKVYKQPRLPRPKHWATDRLYKFLWRKMEPKFDTKTRIKSEKFVQNLAETVAFIQKKKNYDAYVSHLDDLIYKMARLGIIETRMDFNHFCYDFLPYEFRVKVVPMLTFGGETNIPFDPEKLVEPIIRNEP